MVLGDCNLRNLREPEESCASVAGSKLRLEDNRLFASVHWTTASLQPAFAKMRSVLAYGKVFSCVTDFFENQSRISMQIGQKQQHIMHPTIFDSLFLLRRF